MIHTLKNELLEIQIHRKGAELWSIRNKQTQTEHIWQGDSTIWAYHAPLLFPICGKGLLYCHEGKEYQLPMHGFARDLEHQVVFTSHDTLVMQLTASSQTRVVYPFDFKLRSTFVLQGNTLTQSVQVVNCDAISIPFSLGFHTGYRCPYEEGRSLSDYRLVMQYQDTGVSQIPLTDSLFDSTILLTKNIAESVSFENIATSSSIHLSYSKASTLVFWKPIHNAGFLCVEPRFDTTDGTNAGFNGNFRKALHPQEAWSMQQMISF